jgi:hypothetical protein
VNFRHPHESQRPSGSAYRLVFGAFVGQIPDGWVVNHVNGDTQDNHFTNLAAVTHPENVARTYDQQQIAGRARIPNWLTEKLNRPAVIGMLVS